MKKLLFGMLISVFSILSTIPVFASGTDMEYIIEDGAMYYESAYDFGSGRRAIVSEKNPYTPSPCYAGINGFAFLDAEGNILDFAYNEAEFNIDIPKEPEGTVSIFKHFKTASYRNGWVDAIHVIPVSDKLVSEKTPQEPEEIVKQIGEEIKSQNTALVVDFSGSMADNQREVVELLGSLNYTEETTIIVFADAYQVVSKDELISENFNVGYGTHMIKALNKATSYDVENLIIISDLDTYDDVELKPSTTLKKVIIYDPDDGIEDDIVGDVLEIIWNQVEVSRIRIK